MAVKSAIERATRRVLLVLAAIGWQPAAAQEPVEAEGPYLHRGAAAVFPVQVGEFRRFQIYRYDESGRDLSASYNLATPEGRLLLTVYIYPAAAAAEGERSAACDREFESAKNAIQKQYSAGLPVEEGRALVVPGTHKSRRHRAIFHARMNFDGKLQPVRSEAHLYCYVGGDWFVKYRVSAPVAVTAPGAVDAFIRSGPWPGRQLAPAVASLTLRRERGTPLPTQR